MRKLLASDLDGTLIFDNKISQENKDAIRNFKEKGGVFAISTGRPFNGVEKVIEDLSINPDYLILNNGALIMDGHNNIVHKEHISYNIVEEIVNKGLKLKAYVAVETGFSTYTIGITPNSDGNPLTNIDEQFNNFYLKEKLSDVPTKDEKGNSIKFTSITLFFKEGVIEKIQQACNSINDEYGSAVIAYRNQVFIDIVPKGCSKGSGVQWVAGNENIDIGDVFTIGDSWNDDSMFDVTSNSFTFNYAEEALKEKTKYIVTTVAECIEKYILK